VRPDEAACLPGSSGGLAFREIEQVAAIRIRKLPKLAKGAACRLAMAAPDDGGGQSKLRPVDRDADAVTSGAHKLKRHCASNQQNQIPTKKANLVPAAQNRPQLPCINRDGGANK
jgi:hypothetical protein